MENITINKDKLLTTYRTANDEQKEILKQLYGKNIFLSDWREITSYEKACDVLGIQPIEFKEVGDRQQYMRMANAMQQLLVICEAINGDDGWYDKNGWGYFPVFVIYNKQEMDKMGEVECVRKGIHKMLKTCYTNDMEIVGVRCTFPNYRSAYTTTYYGFPLCLNSKEKAKFVGKQFFELCYTCYGITPKIDYLNE